MTTTLTYLRNHEWSEDDWASFCELIGRLVADVNRLLVKNGEPRAFLVGPFGEADVQIDSEAVGVSCAPAQDNGTPLLITRTVPEHDSYNAVHCHHARCLRVYVAILTAADALSNGALSFKPPATPSSDVAIGVKLARLVAGRHLPAPPPALT